MSAIDRKPLWAWLLLGSLLFVATQVDAGSESKAPKELGAVHWLRDFEEAKQRGQEEGKPLFVLFQEVPGCADGVFAHDATQMALAETVFPSDSRLAPGSAKNASARNQKYHLKRKGPYTRVDLTPSQATRLNYLAWANKDPSPQLSPRQKTELTHGR